MKAHLPAWLLQTHLSRYYALEEWWTLEFESTETCYKLNLTHQEAVLEDNHFSLIISHFFHTEFLLTKTWKRSFLSSCLTPNIQSTVVNRLASPSKTCSIGLFHPRTEKCKKVVKSWAWAYDSDFLIHISTCVVWQEQWKVGVGWLTLARYVVAWGTGTH